MSVVSEIMSDRKVITLDVESDPSILDATKLMLKHRLGSVVIVNKNNRPVGIVTERDVLRKVSTNRRMLGAIKVKEIMSSPVVTIKPYDSIETASSAMAGKKIKRLVVVEQDGSMAGVISLTDITKKLAKILTNEQNRSGNLKALLEL
ncbi:MAG TPA: CBS domain-containing protein [Nitrososphaera sp.]|nr:CBS domain-containing protein [Nitrososphaera sp.]